MNVVVEISSQSNKASLCTHCSKHIFSALTLLLTSVLARDWLTIHIRVSAFFSVLFCLKITSYIKLMDNLLSIQQLWWTAMSIKSQASKNLLHLLQEAYLQADSWLVWWTLDFAWRLRGLRSWESPEICAHWWVLSWEREIWQSGCFYFTATCTSISPALSEGMFLPCVGVFHLWYFPHNLVPEHELHLLEKGYPTLFKNQFKLVSFMPFR